VLEREKLFFVPVVFGNENKPNQLTKVNMSPGSSDELDHSRGGLSKIRAITRKIANHRSE